MLTEEKIAQFVYGKSNNKPDYRWDVKLPGFGVRVYPSSKKVFVVSFRLQQRKRILVLGACDTMPIKKARQAARGFVSKQLRQAGDEIQLLMHHSHFEFGQQLKRAKKQVSQEAIQQVNPKLAQLKAQIEQLERLYQGH